MSFNRLHVLIFSAFMIVLSMVGLYLHVEFSGWILFLGILGGVANIEKDDEPEVDDSLTDAERAVIWDEGYTARAGGLLHSNNPYDD
jgi:hypothetical protein